MAWLMSPGVMALVGEITSWSRRKAAFSSVFRYRSSSAQDRFSRISSGA